MRVTHRPITSRLLGLLWVVIALMPLRGWAHGEMATQQAVALTATAAAPAGPGAGGAHPCHGETAAASGPHDSLQASVGLSADGDPGTGHDCQLCDLCHASLGPLPGSVTPLTMLAAGAVCSRTASGIPGDGIGGLFRPPRPRHA